MHLPLATLCLAGILAGAPVRAAAQCFAPSCTSWGGTLELGLGTVNGLPRLAERAGVQLGPLGFGAGFLIDLGEDAPALPIFYGEVSWEAWRSIEGPEGDAPLTTQLHIDAVLGFGAALGEITTSAPTVGLAARLQLGPIHLALRPRVLVALARVAGVRTLVPTPLLELSFGVSTDALADGAAPCGDASHRCAGPVIR